MIIGVPKEIKDNEYRVALTPGGAEMLVQAGHRVVVEQGAGVGSGFQDQEYLRSGATLEASAEKVWGGADMVLKVKEPLPQEYPYLRRDLLLFTYLHLAAERELTEALLRGGTTAIGYETVQRADGSLPLLTPMSQIAGRMAVQVAAHYLERNVGGRGKLLGGVPGVRPSDVVVIGGGTVGTNAAQIALGMGAHVTVVDSNADRLRAQAGGQGAPPCDPRDGRSDEAGQCRGRCGGGPGRLCGDVPAHFAQQPHLPRQRGDPLLRAEYPRGGAAHLDLCPLECDPALRDALGGAGPEGGEDGPCVGPGRQHVPQPYHLSGCG